jgi:hypothetical protein
MQTRKPIPETLREEIKRRAGEAKLAWQQLTGKKPFGLAPISSQPLSS